MLAVASQYAPAAAQQSFKKQCMRRWTGMGNGGGEGKGLIGEKGREGGKGEFCGPGMPLGLDLL